MRQCPKCSKDMELIHFCGDCFHEKVRRDKARLSALEKHLGGLVDAMKTPGFDRCYKSLTYKWLTKAKEILGGGE